MTLGGRTPDATARTGCIRLLTGLEVAGCALRLLLAQDLYPSTSGPSVATQARQILSGARQGCTPARAAHLLLHGGAKLPAFAKAQDCIFTARRILDDCLCWAACSLAETLAAASSTQRAYTLVGYKLTRGYNRSVSHGLRACTHV